MMDVERIAAELKRNPEPSGPCHVCGARDWWYRLPRLIYNTIPSPGGWVCGRCHPMPGDIPVGDDVWDDSAPAGSKDKRQKTKTTETEK